MIQSLLRTYKSTENLNFQLKNVKNWRNTIYNTGTYLPFVQFEYSEIVDVSYPKIYVCKLSEIGIDNNEIIIEKETEHTNTILTDSNNKIYINLLTRSDYEDGVYVYKIYLNATDYYITDLFCMTESPVYGIGYDIINVNLYVY